LSLISTSMPLDGPASLTAADYAEITQYLLAYNGISQAAPAAQPSAPAPGAAAAPSGTAVWPAAPRIVGRPASADPADAELANPSPGDWLLYNGNYAGQRYSRLTQISRENAASLTPKCIFQTGEIGSFQASPIVRAGRVYVTTAHGTYALDGATCRKIWSHQYVPVNAEIMPVNRGVALYRGMLVRGTPDAHLIALDALDGSLLWDIAVADSSKGPLITAAPVAFDGKLFVGTAGADFGAAGRVFAFDAATGRHLWTFDVIPTGKQPGADTWGHGGTPAGGSMWSTITVEPATHSLYVSVGNPGPDFDARERPGDNLYTDSVVVLDAGTGRLKWYVQQTPHDTHDWDTAAAPALYDVGSRKFMAVGSKDARLYLYDRSTHARIAVADLARERLNDTLPLSTDKGLRICPGALGGVEWNGPAYDASKHMLFVNSVDWCVTLTLQARGAQGNTLGGGFALDPPGDARGSLRAFDAATGEPRWIYSSDAAMLAGVTPTAAGIVMTGSSDGNFLVFDSATGEKLYAFYTGGTVAAGVSTYQADGKQYVAVLSGNSSKSTWHDIGAATVLIFGLP
jgi:alcohol dehydrogenase (cytochrome c)